MSGALPRIAPYDLGEAAELPAGRVSWSLEPRRAVLLVHDMQEYFADAFDRQASPFVDVVARIDELCRAARRAQVPVIYSAQPGDQAPADRALLIDFWGTGMTSDPAEQAIIEALAPAEGDHVITKWRYSAFQRSPLQEILAATGRDQLIVTGVYAHIGCLATSLEAFMRDVQPFFVSDAVADFSLADHRMAVDYAARRCARVLRTADVLGALTPTPAGVGEAVGTAERVGVIDLTGGEVPAEGIGRAWLRSAVALRVGDAVDDHDDLIEVGLDSVHVMEIVEELQAAGCEVGFAELAERYTLDEWFALVGV